MVDIALDPNMYYRTMPTERTLYKAAELGFEYVELSPNADFHFWHHRPAADDAFVAELNKAQKETGVKVRTLNPVFNWSCDRILLMHKGQIQHIYDQDQVKNLSAPVLYS